MNIIIIIAGMTRIRGREIVVESNGVRNEERWSV